MNVVLNIIYDTNSNINFDSVVGIKINDAGVLVKI